MKPPCETIRLGKQARDQLIKIKRNTGIENWNVICRWALCVSLREPTPPPVVKASSDDGVEMTWKVFGGENAQYYCALLANSRLHDSKGTAAMDDSALLHAHIRRGLGYLASGADTRSIELLISRWLNAEINLEIPTGDAMPKS
jgi:DNA sulfur modification protein DndE